MYATRNEMPKLWLVIIHKGATVILHGYTVMLRLQPWVNLCL
jgi:hypothetical protein